MITFAPCPDDDPSLRRQSGVDASANGTVALRAVDVPGSAAAADSRHSGRLGRVCIVCVVLLLRVLTQANTAFADPPPNDNFANAQIISGTTDSATGTNVDATKELGEPGLGNTYDHSVWYRWQAPATLCMNFNTVGSGFDTALFVYTGTMLSDLQLVVSNDDIVLDANNRSSVAFNATANATYYFQIAGYSGGTGDIQLNWTFAGAGPANDNFAGAQPIAGTSGAAFGNSSAATKECGEPSHGMGAGRSVWYRWVAPSSLNMTFTTDASDYDTLLCVYTGSTLETLKAIICNDDNSTSQNGVYSTVKFDATAFTTYWVAVDGFALSGGNVGLLWAPTPSNDNFVDAQNIGVDFTGNVSGNNLGAGKEPGEPTGLEGRSLWYLWQPAGNGPVTFNTAGSAFSTQLHVYTGSSIQALGGTEVAAGNSAVTFVATTGTSYRISVEGVDDRSVGAFFLNWSPPPTPTVTEMATRTATATPTEAPASTPSRTPTLTSTSAPTGTPASTPTNTRTSTPTASRTGAPTPTNTPEIPPCAGDCNDDGSVGIEELIRGVNIALGSLATNKCVAFDRDFDGTVSIEEIIHGVRMALNGCVT